MRWEEYYREILDFERFDQLANQDYEERLGKPDELSSCVGLISIAFQKLEDKMSEGISRLLQLNPKLGDILTAELSFKSKLDLFFSLVNELHSDYYFNRLEGKGFEENYLKEFRKAISKCSELRNKVVHSILVFNQNKSTINRIKKTSKAKNGLVIINEKIKIHNLLNIYDFIVSMTMEIDDFFIDFNKR